MNRVRVIVRRDADESLRTTVFEAGTPIGERVAPLPDLVACAWDAIGGQPETVRRTVVQIGTALRDALFEPRTTGQLTRLVDGSDIEMVFDVDDDTMLLPYEMLVLADGMPLATRPTIAISRRYSGTGQPTPVQAPGPLKILAAVAAPTETRTANVTLDVEAEMQAILDAVSQVPTAGGGGVRILEVASLQQITAALRAEEFHVLHLSAHGSATNLELEDEDGDPDVVESADLIAALRAAERALPLVVLSSCGGIDGGPAGLARTLISGGVERVLVMQARVSDRYATLLTKSFYAMLSAHPSEPVAFALGQARHALEEERLADGASIPPEWFVPTLLTGVADRPLWHPTAPPRPLGRRTQAPSGATVRELPLGYLIGRRGPVRDIVRTLDSARGRPGVVITGMGGLGKTAVAGRVAARMRERGWHIAEHVGQWNPTALCGAVRAAIGDDPALHTVADALARDSGEQALKHVHRLLAGSRVLLLFDDFEQNLTRPGGAEFLDPGFAEQFSQLCRIAGTGRLLVTCRYPVPGDLTEVGLTPLSPAELNRMFLRLPQISGLHVAEQRLVARTIGGHPRLIEFVDALLRGGDGTLRPVGERLRRLADEHAVDLDQDRTLTESLDTAVVLGTRDILVDALLDLLDTAERELLLQISLSRTPLRDLDISYARFGAEATRDQRREVMAAIDTLLRLTLLTTDDDRYVVHPWVAQALDAHQGTGRVRRHNRAHAMRIARISAGFRDFDDYSEACGHLLAAGRYAELTELAIPLCRELDQLQVSALLGEIMPILPIDTPGYLELGDREVRALRRTGNLRAATDRQCALVEVLRAGVQSASGSADSRRALVIGLDTLGELAVLAGDLGTAREHYSRSLRTARHLTNTDPDNIDMQQVLSRALESLGDIAVRSGDLTAALAHHTEALAIRRALADNDPARVDLRRDLANACTRLGDLAVLTADLDGAQYLYTESLTLHGGLIESGPDAAESRRGLAIAHGKLGDLAMRAGHGETASRHYFEKLRISTELSMADPDDTEITRDVAIAMQQIGDTSLLYETPEDAFTFFTESLAIHRELAEKDPGNAEYRRDLAIALNRSGDAALQLGELSTASTYYTQALAIHRGFADADSGNARNQRDLSICHDKLGDLAIRTGDYLAADHHYTQSLTLAKQLAAADPTNTEKQRDLSISHHQLARVAVATGAFTLAFRHNTEALTIARRLSTADPENLQLHRDVGLLLWAIGDAAEREHDYDTAVEVYREALAIAKDLLETDPASPRGLRDVEFASANLGRVLDLADPHPLGSTRVDALLEQGKTFLRRLLPPT
ncbi:CHAT domain-containing protein [Nocardia anaemiae]|uniref:CHAT domain-containing protein n=1 Tax=Nocardia anaemiae TaxID=263910 RepID=UPI0007A4854D|nr:CHAT domain-containing protein [Nocardia anaemiae]